MYSSNVLFQCDNGYDVPDTTIHPEYHTTFDNNIVLCISLLICQRLQFLLQEF